MSSDVLRFSWKRVYASKVAASRPRKDMRNTDNMHANGKLTTTKCQVFLWKQAFCMRRLHSHIRS